MTHATTYQSFEPPSRHISVGRIWRLTSDTFGHATGAFMLLGLLPLPVVVASIILAMFTPGEDAVSFWINVVFIALQVILQAIGQNAVVYGAGRQLAGGTFTVSDALTVGVSRLPALLGAWFLVGLVVLASSALLVVPGLIALVALSLVGAACVIERRGPVAALKRSVALAKGDLGRIVGAFGLVVVAPFASIFAVGGTLVGVFYAMHTEFSVIVAAALAILVLIVTVLFMPAISMVLIAALFLELRRIKEGIEPELAELP